LSCSRCLASFRPCAFGGGPQSGSTWSAHSAARTNDLEADEDLPHTVAGQDEIKTLWFKSFAASREQLGVHVARAGAQPYLGPRASARRHDDGWGARRAGCRRVRPLNLSGKSTQQVGDRVIVGGVGHRGGGQRRYRDRAVSTAIPTRRTQGARGRLGGFMGVCCLGRAVGWRRALGRTIIGDVPRPRSEPAPGRGSRCRLRRRGIGSFAQWWYRAAG